MRGAADEGAASAAGCKEDVQRTGARERRAGLQHAGASCVEKLRLDLGQDERQPHRRRRFAASCCPARRCSWTVGDAKRWGVGG
jgi:hypothetical protein